MQIKTPYYPKWLAWLVLMNLVSHVRLTFMKFSMISRRFIATSSGNDTLATHGNMSVEDESLTQDDNHEIPEAQETRCNIGFATEA